MLHDSQPTGATFALPVQSGSTNAFSASSTHDCRSRPSVRSCVWPTDHHRRLQSSQCYYCDPAKMLKTCLHRSLFCSPPLISTSSPHIIMHHDDHPRILHQHASPDDSTSLPLEAGPFADRCGQPVPTSAFPGQPFRSEVEQSKLPVAINGQFSHVAHLLTVA